MRFGGWGSTGYCWCTDADGHEFLGSRGRPGPRRLGSGKSWDVMRLK